MPAASATDDDSSITRTNATVQFIHQSVQDFLSNLDENSVPASFTRITPGNAHDLITKACIRCVCTEELRMIPDLIAAHHEIETEWNNALKLARKLSEDYPFMDYAVKNLFQHSKEA